MPAESDNAENEDIEDKEAEANELFEFKAKFREDVEVFLETAEENWNKIKKVSKKLFCHLVYCTDSQSSV